MLNKVAWTVALLVVVSSAAVAVAYFGGYNVAADEPHWNLTSRVLATVRDRSIAVRTDSPTVPNLADPALIALGAQHYADMCTGCHLAPGMGDNAMRRGLYPKPPNLSERLDRSPAELFWIIKHGIKMSGMPAWGVTHDDESIWGLVAFLRHLPTLDATGYAAFAEQAGGAGHDHGATMDTMTEHQHSHVQPEREGYDH